MTESDARLLLLTRAFEDPPAAPWTEADAASASAETLRLEGESAPWPRLLLRRAALVRTALAERRALPEGDERDGASAGAWAAAAVLLAFVLGLAGTAVGPGRHINLLAPPLLGLLAWNLAVYLGLLLSAALPCGRGAGPLRRWLASLAAWVGPLARRLRRPDSSPAREPLRRFATDWLQAGAALRTARLGAGLHAAAAALACGAIASLYLRGLVFEYRAAWESTFLSVDAVHALLSWVLGPAARLSGIALPDVAELAGLRASLGGGENAARWIHLQALTLVLAVVLPRCLLAAAAAWRAARLVRDFPLSLDSPYFQRLRQALSGEVNPVQVLPYSYELPAALQAGLQRCLGPGAAVQLLPGVPLGGEDDLPRRLAAAPGASPTVRRVALFALTATPERENHGAFVRALMRAQANGGELQVLVDESGFRQRFGADERRLAQRRTAWREMLQEQGQSPLFVDLSTPAADVGGRSAA
ncbi:DUF2868 domain-containing protein [Aquabacterium sp. A7-Y]|uniref:DUF2868 domain-containing protein n=1 Tax=Aquabacterium sp. A7-Y TaxID=1349605 RepID=UPI00223CCDE2|nr:DUF2868 domain-containing protein [Aquabacterium sp. A7-Y]MCW7540364.1 DUF2868 domain-containing protein [Aquabacterium sp. A7-Y]